MSFASTAITIPEQLFPHNLWQGAGGPPLASCWQCASEAAACLLGHHAARECKWLLTVAPLGATVHHLDCNTNAKHGHSVRPDGRRIHLGQGGEAAGCVLRPCEDAVQPIQPCFSLQPPEQLLTAQPPDDVAGTRSAGPDSVRL